jgi:hypothetical protein
MDDERVSSGLRLRRSTLNKLDAAAERLGMSRQTVVELLTDHADSILPPTIDAARLPPGGRGKRGQGRRKK